MFAPKEPYAYFHPGEMLFHVVHKGNQLSDQEIDAAINDLLTWSKGAASQLGLEISRQRERVLRFPSMSAVGPEEEEGEEPRPRDREYQSPRVEAQDPFSLIFLAVENIQNLAANQYEKNLVTLILDLEDNRAKSPLGAALEAVIPNWLSSPASETGSGGGPGGRPVPYYPGAGPAPYHLHLSPIIEGLCERDSKQRGAKVKVAVLDTAPCLPDRVAAYERWQKVDPARNPDPNHELIKNLLGPNGQLHVHHASPEEVFRMRAIHLRDHNYIMTDHGLFVAGIIHSIAPAAEIHLFEVLNSNGVGDLKTIADGLQKVYDSFKGELLVVNCSLVLNLPGENHRITNLDPRLVQRIYPGWDPNDAGMKDFVDPKKFPPDMEFIQRQVDSIQKICNLIYRRNSRVIAASGNDRLSKDDTQPAARFPAAFKSVVGVGALPKEEASRTAAAVLSGNSRESSYSNVADDPASYGVTTLGGEPAEGQGILGVYIGNFPPVTLFQHILAWFISLLGGTYGRNKNDWAWWAGTSFATPILTGAIAAVLSNVNNGLSSAEEAIARLYRARALLQGGPASVIKEDRLPEITQG